MATVVETNSVLVNKLAANTFVKNKSILRITDSYSSTGAKPVRGYLNLYATIPGPVLLYIPVDISVIGTTSSWTASCDFTTNPPEDYYGPLMGTVNFVYNDGSRRPGSLPSMTVLDYSPPKFGNFVARRSDAGGAPNPTGTNASFSGSATVSPLNNINTARYQVRTRVQGSSWGAYTDLATSGYSYSTTNRVLSGTFSTTTAYEAEFAVTDLFGLVSVSSSIPTASVLMHFKGDGTGVAIGAYANTSNLFDVALPARMQNVLTLNYPLYKAYGGLGTNVEDQYSLFNALNMRRGSISVAVSGQSSAAFSVTFSPAFPKPMPMVVLGFDAAGTQSQSVTAVYVESVSTTGFTGRVIRTSTGSATIIVYWLATL